MIQIRLILILEMNHRTLSSKSFWNKNLIGDLKKKCGKY